MSLVLVYAKKIFWKRSDSTFRRTRSTSLSPTSVTTAVGTVHVVSYGPRVPNGTVETGGCSGKFSLESVDAL